MKREKIRGKFIVLFWEIVTVGAFVWGANQAYQVQTDCQFDCPSLAATILTLVVFVAIPGSITLFMWIIYRIGLYFSK